MEALGLLLFIGFIVLVFVLPIRAAAKSAEAHRLSSDAGAGLRAARTMIAELLDRVRILERSKQGESFAYSESLPRAEDESEEAPAPIVEKSEAEKTEAPKPPPLPATK